MAQLQDGELKRVDLNASRTESSAAVYSGLADRGRRRIRTTIRREGRPGKGRLAHSRHGHAVIWERERYDVFRLGKLERADLLRLEFGRGRIVAAIGVRIAWSQVWAICVWIELSAIAGVFDSGLRVYMVHKGWP